MFSLYKKCLILLAVYLLMLPNVAFAQLDTGYTWEQFVEEYQAHVAELQEESDNDVERIDWLEELEEIHRNPIDINTADRSTLLDLHFLSDEQVDSLLAKRNRYSGGFRSLGELMSVRQLTYRDRAWLSQLVCFNVLSVSSPADSLRGFGPAKEHRRWENTNKWYGGTYDVIATADVPLYRRAGFYDYDSDNYPRKMFTGYNFGHTLRIRYNWHSRVKYGATVQQDVGERFGVYGSRPWDYQSAYFYYKSDPLLQGQKSFNRWVIALGDYRLSLGQGLIVGSSQWNQQVALLAGLRTETTRITPNTGTDETRFLRGGAATIRFGREGNWAVTAFGSWRRIDGTVMNANDANGFDPTVSDTITAWKTDGLHRTFQEISKRNVATQILAGGRVGYRTVWFNVGLNAASLHYDKTYNPTPRTYNAYYMRGRNASAVSLDYVLRRGPYSLQGEFALDKRAAYASIWAFRWVPLRSLTVVVQQRSVARGFVSPYGSTALMNSQLQNEHGAMIGAKFSGVRRMEMTAYVNFAYHPAPVYLADTASHRLEGMVQCVYNTDGRWQHTLRYKCKGREQNVTGYVEIPAFDDVLMSWRSTQRLRWQSTWARGNSSVTFGADGACYYSQGSGYDKKEDEFYGMGMSLGGLLFVRASSTLVRRVKTQAMLTAFATDNYNARCYAYVPQLAGAAGFPNFYGRGAAATCIADWRVWRGLSIAARLNVVKYFDREEISSGVNLIKGSWKNDLAVQLRYRL